MKESLLSTCERNFVTNAVEKDTRLDGRSLLEARPVKIFFGSNWGCCVALLGQTRVIAQVTCDIQQPKVSRPNEGMLHINVELNPLAAQHFDGGKQSEIAVLISRQLEKCYKDSKCIDLESLCIVAAKKVWNLRVDINIVNHDGNLVDCASIATLAALAHFHRPDVTSTGENIIVHPFTERDPLPLTLYHHPICVSFITFEGGKTIIDPTYIEERVGVAQLTLGINSYRELCSLHFNYFTKTLTVKDVISAVSNHAANYAVKLIQEVKQAVMNDAEARYKKDNWNTQHFKECIIIKKPTILSTECISIKLRKWVEVNNSMKMEELEENPRMDLESDNEEEEEEKCRIINPGEGTAELLIERDLSLGEGGQNTWVSSGSSEDEEEKGEQKTMEIKVIGEMNKKSNVIDSIDIGEDSEEEVVEILQSKHIIE